LRVLRKTLPVLRQRVVHGGITRLDAGRILDGAIGLATLDGNLWFTGGSYGNTTDFGKMTPAGVATLYALDFPPWGLTAGPDGNIWMTWADGIAMVKP
jgi:hypothetical protein